MRVVYFSWGPVKPSSKALWVHLDCIPCFQFWRNCSRDRIREELCRSRGYEGVFRACGGWNFGESPKYLFIQQVIHLFVLLTVRVGLLSITGALCYSLSAVLVFNSVSQYYRRHELVWRIGIFFGLSPSLAGACTTFVIKLSTFDWHSRSRRLVSLWSPVSKWYWKP